MIGIHLLYNYGIINANNVKICMNGGRNLYRLHNTPSSNWDTKGNVTVEAALVVSVILFISTGLILFTMVIFQKVLLMSLASQAAKQGTQIWLDVRKDMENSAWDNNTPGNGLYWRVFEDSLFNTYKFETDLNIARSDGKTGLQGKIGTKQTLLQQKSEKISCFINENLSRGILKPEKTNLSITYKNSLITGSLVVCIKQEIPIPFKGVIAVFGGNKNIIIEGYGRASIVDADEYIRNIDFVVEYASKSFGLNLDSFLNMLKSKK